METKKLTYKEKLLKNALNYHSNGYKVIFTNDNKIPAVGSWAKYRDNQSAEDIKTMFEANQEKLAGLAVLCTDGMEVIDIDQKYSLDGQLISDYFKAICVELGMDDDNGIEEFFSNVTVAITVSGGAHLIYKTDIAEGNQKLASRYTIESEEGNKRVLLETRGNGGYICVYPTKGYSFEEINKEKGFAPKVSNEWRNAFMNVARQFEETAENHKIKNIASTPPDVQGPNISTIDAFNANHSPYELLEAAGWKYSHTRGENEHLTRPGKNKGVSAGYSPKKNLVYIFTSSSEFDCNRAYNAFQVYSILNHNGNYSDAAKQLYRDGYGDRMNKTQDSFKEKIIAISEGGSHIEKTTSKGLMQKIRATRFDIHKVPKFINYTLKYTDPMRINTYNIAAPGDLITICGLQKSRKSALGSSLVASALSPHIKDVLGFNWENQDRSIIYLDTEQTAAEDYKLQKRMFDQAGIYTENKGVRSYYNPKNYHAFLVGEYTTVQRLAFAAWIVEQIEDVGVLYIDGIVDMCKNYNDLEEAQALVGLIKRKAIQKNMMVLMVLHNARSTGDARGHLGTELLNKSKAVIQVTKDSEGGFSRVNFKDLREREPNDFDFCHDSNGKLELY